MSSFAQLKRQSGNLDKLKTAVEALQSPETDAEKSDRMWKPEVDKAGNGMAVIRFLPASPKDGEDALPWVKIWSHGFQGPGGWFIDNCLTTKGNNSKCPVCEHNTALWNTDIKANRDLVSKQKRKLNYYANVYIVSDSKHPENEGQVKIFRFGKKIFEKITETMDPQFEDEKAINPFDLWEGANFKLKIRKVDGYQNYDKSEFEAPSALLDDDDELEKIWQSEYSLNELLDDKEFKSYDTLKQRLDKVLGLNGETPTPKSTTTVEEDVDTPPFTPNKVAKPAAKKVVEPDITEDDDMEYFAKLADE
jgi:hypothetical protein